SPCRGRANPCGQPCQCQPEAGLWTVFRPWREASILNAGYRTPPILNARPSFLATAIITALFAVEVAADASTRAVRGRFVARGAPLRAGRRIHVERLRDSRRRGSRGPRQHAPGDRGRGRPRTRPAAAGRRRRVPREHSSHRPARTAQRVPPGPFIARSTLDP